MAVKGSGALSLTTDIVGEFGGVAPHSLSEYYGGGTYVPAGANPGIATSGQINMGSHYGAVAATVLTISSNTNNYDIGAQAIAAGGDKSTPVILTINAGVTVGSTSSGTAAMYTGTGWSNGTTINITNNGAIVGANGSNTSGTAGSGGNGGVGASKYGCGSGHLGTPGSSGSNGVASSGQSGGSAFYHSQTSDNNLSVIFDTAGTRVAGSAGTYTSLGGGGGGGGGGRMFVGGDTWAGGGGGGGGASGGSGGGGGTGGSGSSCGAIYGSAGGTASATVGANGGAGGNGGWGSGGTGGRGGNPSASGAAGGLSAGSYPGSGGGGAGSAYSNTGSAGSALSGNTGQIS